MALEMKNSCQECGKELNLSSEAYICSYECTFCPQCSEKAKYICKNCNGELRVRPRRKTSNRLTNKQK